MRAYKKTYNRQNRHTLVYPNGLQLGFSYMTLVFILLPSGKVSLVTARKYSTTTSRHVNQFRREAKQVKTEFQKEPVDLYGMASRLVEW